MKKIQLTAILVVCLAFLVAHAQKESRPRISKIDPYDKGVPGQILQLQVENLGEVANVTMLPAEDFQIEITQDGVPQILKPRLVSMRMTRSAAVDEVPGTLIRTQSVSFVVPQGLHAGDALISISYHDRQSTAVNLTILEQPLPPRVASVPIVTVDPNSLPLAPPPETKAGEPGWRLERDSKTQLLVSPLVDPDDPRSAILVRYKQGNSWIEASANVIHRAAKTEQLERGVTFHPATDMLEVEVPAALYMGGAEMEIIERANGQDSPPVRLKVQIVDSTRAAEAPAENAPRLMSVLPARTGAGQTLMLAVDYLRTLNPDPKQTLIVIEQGTVRYIVRPDQNSAESLPNWTPDSPVLIMARTTRQIIGKAQVRVFNSLRGEQGGLSAPQPIEIVDEPLAPVISGVAQSTAADLGPLRQMYEIQTRSGRSFPEYNPDRTYFTIRGSGFDPNPHLIVITLEQGRRRETLRYADFSFFGGNFLVLRVPAGFSAGPITMTIQQRGTDSLSVPITKTFTLSR